MKKNKSGENKNKNSEFPSPLSFFLSYNKFLTVKPLSILNHQPRQAYVIYHCQEI